MKINDRALHPPAARVRQRVTIDWTLRESAQSLMAPHPGPLRIEWIFPFNPHLSGIHPFPLPRARSLAARDSIRAGFEAEEHFGQRPVRVVIKIYGFFRERGIQVQLRTENVTLNPPAGVPLRGRPAFKNAHQSSVVRFR